MVNSFAKVRKVASDIKKLKIQGSSNVRKTVINTLVDFVRNVKAKDANELREKLKRAAKLLVYARPTEPETKNAIRKIIFASYEELELEELRNHIARVGVAIEIRRKANIARIIELGSEFLRECSVIFTHCHSSTVEGILKRMHEKGYLHAVICTETRPRFQGHITAKNLAKAGIPVTLIVDSAARVFIKHADAFLTGCDAILADGSIVNKIGTSLISLAAKQASVPHYVATVSACFDPETYFSKPEIIEERDATEVWDKRIKGISIRNPAFDVTENELIAAIINEHGIQTPNEFVKDMTKRLSLDKRPFVSIEDVVT